MSDIKFSKCSLLPLDVVFWRWTLIM